MNNFLAELTITIEIFYWLYILLLVFYLIMALIHLYHLWRFGFFSVINIVVMLSFSVLSLFLFGYSLFVLSSFDWSFILIDLKSVKY